MFGRNFEAKIFNKEEKPQEKFSPASNAILKKFEGVGNFAPKYRLLMLSILAFGARMAQGQDVEEVKGVPIYYNPGVEGIIKKLGIGPDTISGAFLFKIPNDRYHHQELTFDKNDKINHTDSVVIDHDTRIMNGDEVDRLIFKVFNEHSIQTIYVVDGVIQTPIHEEPKVEKTNKTGLTGPAEVGGKPEKVRVEVESDNENNFPPKKKNLLDEIRKQEQKENNRKTEKAKKEHKARKIKPVKVKPIQFPD